MVDINSHILYGVDEGALNVEQSIRMIKEAKNAGYTKICFTPHYTNDYYNFSKETIENNLKDIKNALKNENINIELCLGEELQIHSQLLDGLTEIIPLNDSKFVLIDIPNYKDINYLNELIEKLKADGYIPILAHADKYYKAQKNFIFMQDIVSKGVLLQVDINSIIGQYGEEAQKLAYKLLKQNMVSFLASNSHSSASYMMIKNSLAVIKELIGEDKLFELTTINPSKALNNQEIEETEYVKLRNKRKLENIVVGFFRTVSLNRITVKNY